MTTVTVFRRVPPPLIGVCGVVLDRGYESFEETLDWLEASGFLVERFDPYREPGQAARFPTVTESLAGRGERCLPLIFLDDVVVSSGARPTRAQLARIIGQRRSQAELPAAGDGGGLEQKETRVMQSHTIGFVGGGRITAIFLEALGGRGLALERVTVSDTSAEVLARLKGRFPAITTTADNAQAASRERVFLALHPPALKAVLPALASCVRQDAVVVSLAPVLTLARLSEMLGGFARLARVLPNAPSIARAGWNPVAFGAALSADVRAEIEALLDGLGAHPVVPEETLEAYAILAAMGPTYFWFQWQALRELAGTFGLSAEAADLALRAMLDGAIRTLFDAGLTPEQVMDLVPVKPLAEAEPQILRAYRDALPGLYAKLTGTLSLATSGAARS
jgi:pyrroline-5-carboxylate reductase